MNDKDVIGTSKELRGWANFLQKANSAKKIQEFTVALNGLKFAFSDLNLEMKEFNENSKKSTGFLRKIAKLQESMDAQTKSANRVSMAVVGLAFLQVVLVIVQIYFECKSKICW